MKDLSSHSKQPWIYSPKVDLAFVLLPSFVVFCLTWVAVHYLNVSNNDLSPFAWLVLVVGVDVSHVYSTLYRTYFNKTEFQKHKGLYTLLPVLCLLGSLVLVIWSFPFFWTCMAYLAIFHFIRQQYGFLRIYTRKEAHGLFKSFSVVTIYAVTVVPIAMWHVGEPKSFHWFMEGDIWLQPNPFLYSLFDWAFWIILAGYILTEFILSYKTKSCNLPKNILIAGTALSWYYGIVVNNGDLTFTALNVVSHGVPYMALIWIHEKKRHEKTGTASKFQLLLVKNYLGVGVFLGILLAFAFTEEFVWDHLVWHDHPEWFGYMVPFSSHLILCVATALLSLPQLTHYVLDGFIWKIKKDKHDWNTVVLK